MNKDEIRKIERLLTHSFGESISCIENRKRATDGRLTRITLRKGDSVKNYNFIVEGEEIKIRIGKDDYLKFRFVPYSDIDKKYKDAMEKTSIDDLDIDNEILNEYFDRF